VLQRPLSSADSFSRCATLASHKSNVISNIDIPYIVAAMKRIGRTTWAIAEGFIPGKGHGPAPEMTSHEACSILNASDRDAQVTITIFFEDRDPVGPYRFTIFPRRTRHLRFNNFEDPEKIPRGYALLELDRIGRACRRAAYAIGFAPG
jgi:hypothetical protein